MRWYGPVIGQEYIKTVFAWLPIKIREETRWLEQVTVAAIYIGSKKWCYRRFVDEEEQLVPTWICPNCGTVNPVETGEELVCSGCDKHFSRGVIG